MANNKTEPTVSFAQLRSTLLTSQINKKDPALFQFLNQLIDMLQLNKDQTDTTITNLPNLTDVNFLVYTDSLKKLINSKTIVEFLLRGLRADQPDPGAVPQGSLYFVTDELVTEQTDGFNWVAYSA